MPATTTTFSGGRREDDRICLGARVLALHAAAVVRVVKGRNVDGGCR
jgi:hypothetical protein